MVGIYAATLDKDAPSPFAPRSDEGVPEKEDKGDKGADGKSGSKPLHIDIDGLMAARGGSAGAFRQLRRPRGDFQDTSTT